MATKKKSNKKTRTLSEFKSWLDGIEEMQGDDWSPNAEQWAVIREALYLITSEDRTMPSSVNGLPVAYQAGNGAVNAPQIVRQVPVPTSSLLETVPPPRRGAASVAPVAQDGKVKTPDIDTSGGRYESGFV